MKLLHVSHFLLRLLAVSHCLSRPMELLHVSHFLFHFYEVATYLSQSQMVASCLSYCHGVALFPLLCPLVAGCL